MRTTNVWISAETKPSDAQSECYLKKIMKMKFRFFSTGLTLGILATAFLFALSTLRVSLPLPVQAAVGTITINQSTAGTFTAQNMVAQKFTDSANSAYFIDPAATADSLVAAGKVTAGSFAGDGSLLTGISGIPAGLVAHFNLSACPTGWTELTAARGMYIVGLPLSGTLAGTSGTALTNLESRPVGQHLHSVDPPITSTSTTGAHTHSIALYRTADNSVYSDEGGSSATGNYHTTGSAGNHSHTVDIAAFNSANAGSVAGTNAPYIQLLTCQKS